MLNLNTKASILFTTFIMMSGFVVHAKDNDLDLIVVGVDDKVALLEQGMTNIAPSTDYVCFLDVGKKPLSPKLDCSLELENSIFGPPVNLAVLPDQSRAIVASSVSWILKNDKWVPEPDTDLYLVDITAKPKVIHKVNVPPQPSGINISRDGKYVAVAHRAAKSVSLLKIEGNQLILLDSIELNAQISAVGFTPDAQRIYATKFDSHHIAVIDIKQNKLLNTEKDIPVGLWPYNLKVDPKGRYIIAANTGNSGLPDGNVDTLTVIDATTNQAVNTVNVGDGPEGIAISHDGSMIAVPLLQGSGLPFKNTTFYRKHGGLVVFSIDGFSLTEIARFEVGGFPEGVVFSRDGKHIYVGNLTDNNVEIFQIDGNSIVQTGRKISLPGQPVSMGNSLP